jgi:hypothetical protein
MDTPIPPTTRPSRLRRLQRAVWFFIFSILVLGRPCCSNDAAGGEVPQDAFRVEISVITPATAPTTSGEATPPPGGHTATHTFRLNSEA